MDYKQKIRNKWPSGKELTDWLDKTDPEWREEDPSLIADSILKEALGYDAHGRMEVDESERAEEWIMETYLGA